MQLLPHHENLVFPLLLGGFLLLFVALVILPVLAAVGPRQGESEREQARPKLAVTAVLPAFDAEGDIGQAHFARKFGGRSGLLDFLFEHLSFGSLRSARA